MKTKNITLPEIVSRDEWLSKRKKLLQKEKKFTRARDQLNAQRRRLPMVEIEKNYEFEGTEGKASLLDLFDGRRQLIIYHFMWLWDNGEPKDKGCPACTAGADEVSGGLLDHLHARDTSLVYVSRAPLEKIEAYKASKGWMFPFYSSYGSDFNYDFHVSFDESVAPFEYNYLTKAEIEERGFPVDKWEQPFDLHGHSCFLRDGDLPAPRPKPGQFCVYVLKCSDGSFYKGQTDNFPRRLLEHDAKQVGWTASRLPIEPIHWEIFDTRDESIKREKELKTDFGRKWLKRKYEERTLAAATRQAGRVFHTYSTYARGAEQLGGSYYWLDMTALGRQEAWEEPKDRVVNKRGANPADFAE